MSEFIYHMCEDADSVEYSGFSLASDSSLSADASKVMSALSSHVRSDSGYFAPAPQDESDALTAWLIAFAGF